MAHNVALVDDHLLVRDGLTTMVNGLNGYTVTMYAGHGQELVDAMSKNGHPDIAIVDLNMPVMDGYETIAWLKANAPKVRAVALTFDAVDGAMIRAIRAGARGFLLKDVRPPQMQIALDSIMNTGYFFTEEMQLSLVEQSAPQTLADKERDEILAMITPREMELLLLVCSEDEPTYEEIAKKMGASRRTIDNFRTHLFEKFQLKSKVGLVLFAVKWGLLK